MDFSFKSFSNGSNFSNSRNNSKSETAGSLASSQSVETAGSLAWVSLNPDFDSFNSNNPFVQGIGGMLTDSDFSNIAFAGDFGGDFASCGEVSSGDFSCGGDASFSGGDCGSVSSGGDCGGGGGGDCGSFSSVC